MDCCPYTSKALEKFGEENLEGNIPVGEDQYSIDTDNFGPWILVEKKKYANKRANSTLA